MPPEISRRAKQYGLDQGNLTVRQMVLVLLDQFLAEEGY
jgi:hypothetical protein